MSDAPNKRLDPTQSMRVITSPTFEEENMTIRAHQDVDKHFIGDALPVPSDEMVQMVGTSSWAGELPFPARADHVHGYNEVDTSMFGMFGSSGQMYLAPGSSYITGLVHQNGRNMLHDPQLIAFPVPGVYLINMLLTITRATVANFTNELNVNFTYWNGTNVRGILRDSLFDIPQYLKVSATDYFITATAPSVTDNVQFNIAFNDNSNWYVNADLITVIKLAPPYSS